MDTFIPSNIDAMWIIFASTSVIILFSGKFLASSTDTIAVRTGLGHTFVGFVLLATATSIPELATGISSIQLLDQPDIAAGDVFGSRKQDRCQSNWRQIQNLDLGQLFYAQNCVVVPDS